MERYPCPRSSGIQLEPMGAPGSVEAWKGRMIPGAIRVYPMRPLLVKIFNPGKFWKIFRIHEMRIAGIEGGEGGGGGRPKIGVGEG